MFTKAIIEGLPSKNKTTYTVRVPLFEDTTGNKVLYDALLCGVPGQSYAYEIGDVVFVLFLSDDAGELLRPVILGQLVLPSDITNKSSMNILNLNVKNSVKLPTDSLLGNNISVKMLEDLYTKIMG